jgi:DNA repair exonuclease SbcCD ATPase subunit
MADHAALAERLLAGHRHAEQRAAEEADRLAKAERRLAACREAQALVQAASQAAQEYAHATMAGLVSRCLASVFEDPYGFAIRFERKRGRTEARFVFTKDDNDIDPMTEGYGGAVDVAAFGLRLACLALARPAPRKLLVLDEPFRNVHGADNRRRLAGMVVELAKELKVQVVMATGLEWLRVGNVVELGD